MRSMWNSAVRRRRPTYGRLLLVGVAAASLTQSCSKAGPNHVNARYLPNNYVEGSFVVSAESSAEEKDVSALAKKVGDKTGCSAAPPKRVRWGDDTKVISAGLRNTYHLRFKDCQFSAETTGAIVKALQSQKTVTAAEAQAVSKAVPVEEDDPLKRYQRHFGLIRREAACKKSAESAEPVVVAVIDTGVDVDHPDLQDSFYRNESGEIVGANFVGSGARMPPDRDFDDDAGHGTHVAGLIAAASGNGEGIAGVGACTNVKIMPVRVLNGRGSGNSLEIERGIKWAADHGAHVLNLSLGHSAVYRRKRETFRKNLYSSLQAQDVAVFAAAGNDGYYNGAYDGGSGGYRYSFPASYEGVFSVAATDNDGELTSFSNHGPLVDLAAPGKRLLSTVPGRYKRMSGTSMASPVAAGVYALGLSASNGRSPQGGRMDLEAAADLLESSVTTVPELSRHNVTTGGVINADKLVQNMQNRFPPEQKPEDGDPGAGTPGNEQPQDPDPDMPDGGSGDDQEDPNPNPGADEPTPEPEPTGFRLVGLADGDEVTRPVRLGVAGLPDETYGVYFFLGDSRYSFAKAYAGDNSRLETDQRFLFFGTRQLRVVAANRYGRILGELMVTVHGL